MTNKATLNTPNKNTNNCGKRKYILRTKQTLLLSESSRRERERERERERDRQRDRQTERERETDDRQTENLSCYVYSASSSHHRCRQSTSLTVN